MPDRALGCKPQVVHELLEIRQGSRENPLPEEANRLSGRNLVWFSKACWKNVSQLVSKVLRSGSHLIFLHTCIA